MIELLIAVMIFVPGIIIHSYRDHAREEQLASMCGSDRMGDNKISADERMRRMVSEHYILK